MVLFGKCRDATVLKISKNLVLYWQLKYLCIHIWCTFYQLLGQFYTLRKHFAMPIQKYCQFGKFSSAKFSKVRKLAKNTLRSRDFALIYIEMDSPSNFTLEYLYGMPYIKVFFAKFCPVNALQISKCILYTYIA